MISGDQKLNPDLFEKNIHKMATRRGFGEGLLEAGHDDDKIVALCADLKESTYMHLFAEHYPERFVEMGVAEQNLAAVASGMAAMGKVPFMSSYATFSPGRNWEQIRTTICYNDRPVKIVGSHAGVSVGPDGGSHQALEDIALMRVLPNMEVVSPCDAIEAEKATVFIAKTKKPTYLRLLRAETPIITTVHSPFKFGQANILRRSSKPQVAIVATGQMVYQALLASMSLSAKGVDSMVLNIHTIKPIDKEALIGAAKNAGAVVTAEEHQVVGGLGSAVAEVLAQNCPVPIEFVGVRDQFGQSGTPEELLEHYGLTYKHILAAAFKVITRIR